MIKPDIVLDNLDSIVKEFGIKYVFIESGHHAIKSKCVEQGLHGNVQDYKFWCELSWGSADEDKYDFAYADFGKTLGAAIGNCINAFQRDVREQLTMQVAAAKDVGIYNRLVA